MDIIQQQSKTKGGWWPDENQLLLLKAGLVEPTQALLAWKQWLDNCNITHHLLDDTELLPKIFDPIDEASRQLLPLVHRNLENLEEPFSKRLKGYCRFKWVRTQQLLAGAAQLCDLLEGAGIPTMLINATALSLWYYTGKGARSLYTFSISVPFEHRLNALKLLKDSAFRYQLQYQNAQTARLISDDKLNCDLYWSLFHEHTYAKADSIFWENAVPCRVGESTTSRRLLPAHQFFHSLLQGNRWNRPAPLGWIPDCVMIARQHPIDWPMIFTLAEQFQYVSFIQKAVPFLRNEFELDISEDNLQKLKELRVSSEDAYYFTATSKAPKFGRLLTYIWRNYALYTCFIKHQRSTSASFPLWIVRKIIQRLSS